MVFEVTGIAPFEVISGLSVGRLIAVKIDCHSITIQTEFSFAPFG